MPTTERSLPGFESPGPEIQPLKQQLLKWIGNKQRFAAEIVSYFPRDVHVYYEPFLGSGAVLGTLSPRRAVASDALAPLVAIWKLVHDDPRRLALAYRRRWELFQSDRQQTYERIKARYNRRPNAYDLFFLSRSCYGGVIRFRKDGYMSTPIGIHNPVPPASVASRISTWQERTLGTTFRCCDFEDTVECAGVGDVVYCDPPYSDTQAILYGSQSFSLARLFRAIDRAKRRGARVALSIDGHKKSGSRQVDIGIPDDLFEREVMVNCGRSMLRRFQMEGQSLEAECVADRLLLTW